jgi:branched-chain amino acid transport system substrate-binding protein
MRRKSWVTVFGCVAMMVAAGCGSTGASKSAGSESGSPEPGGSSLTGEPLKLGTITGPYNVAAVGAGVRSATAAINKAGGVQGRPLQVSVCDNQNSATAAGACAQGFADDHSTLATVGVLSGFGATTNPIFEKASLAGVGTAIASKGDYTSANVFPTEAGVLNLVGAVSAMVDQLKLKKIGSVAVDTPAGSALPNLIESVVLDPLGMKFTGAATVPLTSTDLTPQAAALAETDGQLVSLTSDLAIGYIRAARKQGFEGPLLVHAAQLSEGQIKDSLKGANQELYTAGAYDISSPGWKQMQDEAKAIGTALPLVNAAFATGWLAVHIFAQVAAKLPTISRASVLDAMKKLTALDTNGMTAPLNYSVPGTKFGGKAPRLFPCIQFTYLYKFDTSAGVNKLVSSKPEPLLGSS